MDFINIVNVNLVGRVKTGFLRHVSRPILRRIVAPQQKKESPCIHFPLLLRASQKQGRGVMLFSVPRAQRGCSASAEREHRQLDDGHFMGNFYKEERAGKEGRG